MVSSIRAKRCTTFKMQHDVMVKLDIQGNVYSLQLIKNVPSNTGKKPPCFSYIYHRSLVLVSLPKAVAESTLSNWSNSKKANPWSNLSELKSASKDNIAHSLSQLSQLELVLIRFSWAQPLAEQRVIFATLWSLQD